MHDEKVAKAAGVPVVQDVGGEDRPISDAQLARVDFISPNLSELQRLIGSGGGDSESESNSESGSDGGSAGKRKLLLDDDASVVAAARRLQSRGARNVLVTLGERGSILVCERPAPPIPPPPASPDKDCDSIGDGGGGGGSDGRGSSTGFSTSMHGVHRVLRQGCCPIPGAGVMVDETGAGDCFRAAFTVALVEGKPLEECLRFAAAAGAVAV